MDAIASVVSTFRWQNQLSKTNTMAVSNVNAWLSETYFKTNIKIGAER